MEVIKLECESEQTARVVYNQLLISDVVCKQLGGAVVALVTMHNHLAVRETKERNKAVNGVPNEYDKEKLIEEIGRNYQKSG